MNHQHRRVGTDNDLVDDRLAVGDVVVTHPAAAAHARAAAQTAGSAAKRAEDAKVPEFQRHGDGPGFEIVPLANRSVDMARKQATRFLPQVGDARASVRRRKARSLLPPAPPVPLVSEGGGSNSPPVPLVSEGGLCATCVRN